MSRLDEIQNRLEVLHRLGDRFDLVFELLQDITSELKRIDGERKAMDKLLIELAAKDV